MKYGQSRKSYIVLILLAAVLFMNCYAVSSTLSYVNNMQEKMNQQALGSTCEETINSQASFSDNVLCPAATVINNSKGEVRSFSKGGLRNYFLLILNICVKMLLVFATGLMSITFIVSGIRPVFEKVLMAIHDLDGCKEIFSW